MKRLSFMLSVLLIAAVAAPAQRHKLTSINAETPEGQLLQSIGTEQDPAKKLELMEKFAAQYPKHEAAGWVLSQMQQAYINSGNIDKALSTGEALLAMDPDDTDTAYANLKAAEKKQDPDAILKWSTATSNAARKTAGGSKPADMDEATWKQMVDYAKQVDTYTEYALSAAVLQTSDPNKIVMLTEALEQRNPNSQYLAQALSKFAAAARQANQLDKATALGDRALARNQTNDDLLLLMADTALNRKQPDRVIVYTTKLIELSSSQTKPQGISDADWQKKRDTTLGLAYWMQGITLAGQNKFAQADKSLRAALPLI
ncbi:MAG TPA: hypothetical protein VFL57_21080, partial [Bryobacteraceae bacterium]|nr:hypothetical protein [Bryobacteraceae bacterium]